jgi:hypothetical protein
LDSTFTRSHRGGSGAPLVCLHGFTDTWRSWDLVLPALERRHDVLAPTLPGHAGGPPIEGEIGDAALQLAARGRADSVVALAPAGGWARGDESLRETLGFFTTMQELLRAAAPHAEAVLASAQGRRRATEFIVTNFEHIPAELLAHQMRGAASCGAVAP